MEERELMYMKGRSLLAVLLMLALLLSACGAFAELQAGGNGQNDRLDF